MRNGERIGGGFYGFNLTLLLAVILFGDAAKGATRWIPTPFGFNIQPSEFAKIFIILTLADFLADRKGKLNNYSDFIMPFLFVLPPMLLIFKQPDLGTTLVFVGNIYRDDVCCWRQSLEIRGAFTGRRYHHGGGTLAPLLDRATLVSS